MKKRRKDPVVDTHLCQPPRRDDAGPVTYSARYKGRNVRVTVPERDEDVLAEALKDCLSPEAVAAIATILKSRVLNLKTPTKNDRVNKEIAWFADELIDLVGGPEACRRLTEEIGG